MSSVNIIIPCVLAASFLVMGIFPSALAQRSNPDDERSIPDDERRDCESAVGLERKQCESETAATRSSITVEVIGRSVHFGESRLPLAQIRADISYLRTVSSYLSHTASQSSELNFKAIAKSTSETKKRAARLKDSLALLNPERSAKRKEEKVPIDSGQLRVALSALSALISDALCNPGLKGYLLDMTRSAEAGSELDEIVELSRLIRMSSEMLGKGRQ